MKILFLSRFWEFTTSSPNAFRPQPFGYDYCGFFGRILSLASNNFTLNMAHNQS
ncbi:hypothetical protein [uncultured Winogradskyella sp.]|uniref:hypothetical protein n=1 Tax=uncultured Winogradskyella sp. TaxID=395353 RepID=UPI0030DBEADB